MADDKTGGGLASTSARQARVAARREEEWEKKQRRFEDEREQREREVRQKRELREKKKNFFDECMKLITCDSRFAESLYDFEQHQNEIRDALKFIHENAFDSWRELHAKGALKPQPTFNSEIFADMFIGNLRGKADKILQSLESKEFREKFRINRGEMDEILKSDAPAAQKRRAKELFYSWKSAFIGDMIFDHAVETMLEHLDVHGSGRPAIKNLLRNGSLRMELSDSDHERELLYREGISVPTRRYLLHNSDVIHAINTMNKQMDGELIRKPLIEGTHLGAKKRVFKKGNSLHSFGLEMHRVKK